MEPNAKERQFAELLANGYRLDDLTWIGPSDPVRIDLKYASWESPEKAAQEELERHRNGTWIIKASAVERKIREMPGCENYSITQALSELPEWVRSLVIMRPGR